jgi:hypothetical protein
LVSGVVNALAVPDTLGLRVTDVTTSSISVVWLTDVAATPAVEIYSDASMTARMNEQVTITPMPDASPEVGAAALRKGIMKVRVAGLLADTKYFIRTVTADPVDPLSVGYSPLQEVTTAKATVPYTTAADGSLQAFANDLISFKVYIQPSDLSEKPGLGDLLVLETPGSPYPVSAFAGMGTLAPEGIIDLNNLYSASQLSLNIQGGEKAQLHIYRGGTLFTLLHYRWLSSNSQTVAVNEPVKGFFADINLDGKVDEADFAEFRKQYRTEPDDGTYNPDYNFFPLSTLDKIDAQDFAAFAKEYGKAVAP